MSALPKPIRTVLDASAKNDQDLFLSAFRDDALLCDSHRKYWGRDAIRRWCSIEWTGDSVTVEEVRDVVEHHGEHVVHIVLDGVYDKDGLPADYVSAFLFKIVDDRITRLIILPSAGRRLGKLTQTRLASTCFSAEVAVLPVAAAPQAAVPGEVANLLSAIADRDLDRAVAAFAPDAYANDKHRGFWGADDIRRWVEADLTGPGARYEVFEATEHLGDTILTARLAGGYDRDQWNAFLMNSSVTARHGFGTEVPVALWAVVRDGLIVQLVVTPIDGALPIETDEQPFYVPNP